MFRKFAAIINEVALIKQIAVGLVIGILLALYVPKVVPVVTIFGDLFVKALKGVAPVLVFFLVMNAMAKKKSGGEANMKPIIGLYVIGTFFASLVGVSLSFLAPTTLHLQVADAKLNPPSGIVEVLHNLILSVVDNPIAALLHANYIGILAWAVVFGIAMNMAANETTKMLWMMLQRQSPWLLNGLSISLLWALWAWWQPPSATAVCPQFPAIYICWQCSSAPTSW